MTIEKLPTLTSKEQESFLNCCSVLGGLTTFLKVHKNVPTLHVQSTIVLIKR